MPFMTYDDLYREVQRRAREAENALNVEEAVRRIKAAQEDAVLEPIRAARRKFETDLLAAVRTHMPVRMH
jgi:hypothetical protein